MIDFQEQIERTLHAEQDSDSHTEPEPAVFHPSQLARCKRQATISKFGLDDHDTETLGVFHVGTMIHDWLEDTLSGRFPGVEFEKEISQDYDYRTGKLESIVKVVGRCDVYDSHENTVYDFKTRNGWYKFDPPSERHVDQLTLYMDALDANYGQVVYINKSDLEVRTWPENDVFEFGPERRDRLVEKAQDIHNELPDTEIECVADVPFEPCGCWLCEQETEG